MKVLLVNPVSKSGDAVVRSGRCQIKVNPGMGIWPPIDLLEVAANIDRNFYECQILDAVIENMSFTEMINRIKQINPDFLLLQTTTPTFNDDLEIIKWIKSENRQITTLIWGLHPTLLPQEAFENSPVDLVIRGEPDIPIRTLFERLKANEGFSEIPGLCYKIKNQVIISNLAPPIINLDELPVPARDLIDNKRYRLPLSGKPFTIIKTSRGCPYPCIFCTSQAYHGSEFRSRSASSVIREIAEIVDKYSIQSFLFLSDTFNLNRNFVLELGQGIIQNKLDIEWFCNIRADLFDQEMARAMSKAGCYLISIGAESGSDELLENMGKKMTTADIIRAVQIARNHNIKTLCYFIFGLPGETEETIKKTIDFAIKLNPDYAHFYTATPFPGTKLFEIAKTKGYLVSTDWKRYFHGTSDVISYPHLPAELIKKYIRKAYARFYFRPIFLLKELIKLKKNGNLSKKLNIGFQLLQHITKIG